jgi:sugar lactone lactonase YvrE
MPFSHRLSTLTVVLAFGLLLASPLRAENRVIVNDDMVYPESGTALADGTVIVGSKGHPFIYRALPGKHSADRWIKLSDDFVTTRGLLADPKTGTLWVCALMPPESDAGPKRHSALQSYDLISGKEKKRHALPGATNFCNDIAVSPKGTVYVSDTYNGKVLKISDSGALEVWLSDPLLIGVDGITFVDSTLYLNNILTGHVYRVSNAPNKAAGQLVDITLSRPLGRPDGMRAQGKRLFVTEKDTGIVSELKLQGDQATVVALKEGLGAPTAVEPVGKTLWIVESKLHFTTDPKFQGQDPGKFYIYALPIPTP